jgi:hypothetical protein
MCVCNITWNRKIIAYTCFVILISSEIKLGLQHYQVLYNSSVPYLWLIIPHFWGEEAQWDPIQQWTNINWQNNIRQLYLSEKKENVLWLKLSGPYHLESAFLHCEMYYGCTHTQLFGVICYDHWDYFYMGDKWKYSEMAARYSRN